jgi:hypothetical protein
MLLRAWKLMEEDQKISQQAALAAALRASGFSDFGLLSCGVVGLGSDSYRDRVVGAGQPPGVTEQVKQEVRKASESAWVDRFRSEASKQRQAQDSTAAADGKRRQEWAKKALEWKDMWAQRVRELEEQNGYNATEAAEERRKMRIERRKQNKATHKKRVRYLPPEEAAKVQAREDKWQADQAKQRADDEQKAESRREAFKRQVEEAQRIIEEKRGGTVQPGAEHDEEEMSAA